MEINYQVSVTEIGLCALEALQDNMLIMFKAGAPKDIVDYCFIHSHDLLRRPIKIGDQVKLGDDRYVITAVGDVASENLAQLGHISFFFDGATQAVFPGAIHLQGGVPSQLVIGSRFIFFSL